jgi:hypothetical protein
LARRNGSGEIQLSPTRLVRLAIGVPDPSWVVRPLRYQARATHPSDQNSRWVVSVNVTTTGREGITVGFNASMVPLD